MLTPGELQAWKDRLAEQPTLKLSVSVDEEETERMKEEMREWVPEDRCGGEICCIVDENQELWADGYSAEAMGTLADAVNDIPRMIAHIEELERQLHPRCTCERCTGVKRVELDDAD